MIRRERLFVTINGRRCRVWASDPYRQILWLIVGPRDVMATPISVVDVRRGALT